MQSLWMLAGSFFFASMAVCVEYASACFTSSDLVFWRGVIGVMHAWRSMIGVISLGAWFYALGVQPLATAMTLRRQRARRDRAARERRAGGACGRALTPG